MKRAARAHLPVALVQAGPPSRGVAYRLGSFIIKTASSKKSPVATGADVPIPYAFPLPGNGRKPTGPFMCAAQPERRPKAEAEAG
jgi:hypothetical protein